MAEDAETDTAPAPKKSKLPLILAAVGILVLIGGGVGAAFAFGLFGGGAVEHASDADAHGDDGHGEDDHAAHAPADAHDGAQASGHHDGTPVFVDLPQILVNLVVEGGRPRFLKLSLAVEVDDSGTADRIHQLSPRIVDSFQLYLRTLTPNELQGPGSMFRLKEDLHVRIHRAIEPARVRDVLFKEMLVQ